LTRLIGGVPSPTSKIDGVDHRRRSQMAFWSPSAVVFSRSVFSMVFSIDFLKSELRFGSQNGAKIDSKSMKSRYKTVCSHRVGFSNDSLLLLFLNLTISNRKIIEKLQVLLLFQRCRFFRLRTRLGVHFCLHFVFQMGEKSTKRAIKTTIEISIEFLIDLLTILAPCWDPFWRPLGHFGL